MTSARPNSMDDAGRLIADQSGPDSQVEVFDGGAGVAAGTAHPNLDWETLYERLGERVFRMLHRMTRDADQAADLTHDTFVRVFERLDQFRGRGSLDGWVLRIASNQFRDRFRRRRFQTLQGGELRAQALRREEQAVDEAGRLAMRQALASIPDDHRVALLLHDVDGFNHREIAEMLDVAEGTSKARVSRARTMLREQLKRQGDNR